jgi:ketosteroid isomerase-like protein
MAQASNPSPVRTMRETILAFIDRINAHDAEGLGALMSDDHTFIVRTAIRFPVKRR